MSPISNSRIHIRMIAALSVVLVFLCLPLTAKARTITDCAALAERAGKAAGLPQGVLSAIALAESGYRAANSKHAVAWPWTLNQGGQGMYFASRKATLAYLKNAVATGVTNIDVGCMQLNYRWHHQAFSNLADMLDPVKNTTYAAQHMAVLYKRFGSWDTAISRYHTANSERGARYLARVNALKGTARVTETTSEATASSGVILVADKGGLIPVSGGKPLVIARAAPGDEFLAGVVLPRAKAPVVLVSQSRLMDSSEAPQSLQDRWKLVEILRQDLGGSNE